MNGNLTTPAALNGDVRTIPLIDKTLTIEGKCADAKATGDRFDAQAAIIEEHGINIADNAALIQTLSAENGVQDTTLGEHKALIVDNAQKIAVCESGIGELHRKASEAEDAIDDLKEKATAGEESFAEVFERLQQADDDIAENFKMITQEVKPELATAQNDIEVLKNGLDLSTVTATPVFEAGVNNVGFACYKMGQVCVIAFKAITHQDVLSNVVLFTGLPKPLGSLRFYARGFDDIMYSFDIYAEGDYGVIKNVDALPGTNRYEGTVTYIVAADSAV